MNHIQKCNSARMHCKFIVNSIHCHIQRFLTNFDDGLSHQGKARINHEQITIYSRYAFQQHHGLTNVVHKAQAKDNIELAEAIIKQIEDIAEAKGVAIFLNPLNIKNEFRLFNVRLSTIDAQDVVTALLNCSERPKTLVTTQIKNALASQ
jgi:hypothetical protein